ncbi:hypothetical protein M0804_012294 [Polistes exclamans]|nr:hypothetical protein M0804_012294 [Polistes exclamans]
MSMRTGPNLSAWASREDVWYRIPFSNFKWVAASAAPVWL